MTDTEPTITHPPDLTRLRNSSSPTIPTKLSSSLSILSENAPSTATTTTTASSANPTRTTSPTNLQSLQHNGFIILPSLLPPHLLLAARATSKYLVQRTRLGTFWPHVRTVPKQYPPWPLYKSPDQGLNIWGVQHLLHPDLSVRDVYSEVYFCEEVLGVVRGLLAGEDGRAVEEDELVMELFNLLVSPGKRQGFELEWHRDDVRPDVTEDEEARLLSEKTPAGRQLHAQYNIALFEDESLVVVPGSHRRVRTEQERKAGKYDVLPGEVRVNLGPGDAVFYDSNILHRGVYGGIDEHTELGRMTLHGSVGLRGYGAERCRQVLQHGVGEWVDGDGGGFGSIQDEGKRRVAEVMRRNLVEMGRGVGDVGFSLEG
ncbi:hypothetical protein PMZ80_005648 [Knufia obscura]|uniref:Phytanoyl-CoA dioxygenase n=1 Tax=Knufia obscura TaxID=1635080 RepID=A0ABR0RM79_9EURO|nr:hypothetical protein PMZ80_005648 [Knufia obscura]